MITAEGRMHERFGRQVRGRGGDRLNTWLLIIGDDRHCVAQLRLRPGRSLLQDFHLAIDAQDFRHLLLEVGVTPFKIAVHLVRLDLLFIENLA